MNDPINWVAFDVPGWSLGLPKLSTTWQCELFGAGPNGMILTPNEGSEPNWFWRQMQYLCFGNKWVRKEALRGGGRE